jgi:hypothetical protein
MYFIPKSEKEKVSLLNEIVQRTFSKDRVEKSDFFHALSLLESIKNEEIEELKNSK